MINVKHNPIILNQVISKPFWKLYLVFAILCCLTRRKNTVWVSIFTSFTFAIELLKLHSLFHPYLDNNLHLVFTLCLICCKSLNYTLWSFATSAFGCLKEFVEAYSKFRDFVMNKPQLMKSRTTLVLYIFPIYDLSKFRGQDEVNSV